MSDGGEIEVENSALVELLPKDVVKEVGNVKLFNKWDYDVEVRDISLTYVELCPCRTGFEEDFSVLWADGIHQ
jgi:small subunit ribosomal protein S5e